MDQLQMQVPGSGGGGGTTVNTGVTSVDFGAFPGSSHATVVITGQTSLSSGSLINAWIMGVDTADHTADEHVVESIKVTIGDVIAGTGFTIHAVNSSEILEPLLYNYGGGSGNKATGANLVQNFQRPQFGNIGTLIYGQWTIGWMWI